MEQINYEDFAKLEIKIGTILSVEIVPDADKLLRLMVDFGEAEPRQIVSGIRSYFEDINVLVGKQCPFVVNLAPRTIRGFESNGMIMAASGDGAFSLLHPSVDMPAGSQIK